MAIQKNTPQTVREQLFYIDGCLRHLEEDENGCIKVCGDWLIREIGIALQLAYNEKLPTITYRDIELPKGTFVSSTDYPVKRIGIVDYPQTTVETY
jgi:hypothetical protein